MKCKYCKKETNEEFCKECKKLIDEGRIVKCVKCNTWFKGDGNFCDKCYYKQKGVNHVHKKPDFKTVGSYFYKEKHDNDLLVKLGPFYFMPVLSGVGPFPYEQWVFANIFLIVGIYILYLKTNFTINLWSGIMLVFVVLFTIDNMISSYGLYKLGYNIKNYVKFIKRDWKNRKQNKN